MKMPRTQCTAEEWHGVTLVPDMSSFPSRGPSPAELAAIALDGSPETTEQVRSDALKFLDQLTPLKLRTAFFQSLVRGTEFTVADLARETGLSKRGVYKALNRAADKAGFRSSTKSGGCPKPNDC